MVDHDPDGYRPRRAFVDSDADPQPDPGPRAEPRAESSPPEDEEDQTRPLFRDEADGADRATVRPVPGRPDGSGPGAGPALTSTGRRRPTFVSRQPLGRGFDDDDEQEDGATALLPRTTVARDGSSAAGFGSAGYGDEEVDGPRRLGRRTRLGLLIGAVAAVVAVGLAVIYAVARVGPSPSTSDVPFSGAPTAPSAASAATPGEPALLSDALLLSPQGARPIATKRNWTVGDTVRGDSPDAAGPACLGADPLEGAPTPQQKALRTLSADGKKPPTVLHLAQAYASAAEAGQAYAVTAKALGSCTVTGDYLASGRVVEGEGDEATGSLIRSVAGSEITGHTVLVSRTGRVLDVVDATAGTQAPNVNDVAKALASVVNAQCAGAGGACARTVKVSDGPPPLGGDEPGFLATGDLPPAGQNPAPWVATPVEAPKADFTGSSCETVDWTTVPAKSRSSRVYLLQDVPGFFGLNEIVVQTKDDASARKLVNKVRQDWTTCKQRKLTATVSSPVKVTGVGARGASISGYTTEVKQQAGDTSARYRVGIAATGSTVAFTFLNPVKGLDLTSDEWNEVAVRAVQRATQV